MDDAAQALRTFVRAYTQGDAEAAIQVFSATGALVYNGDAEKGREAIRKSLAMAGKFAFTIERAFGDGAVQAVEGRMIPMYDGWRKEEDAIPYAGVANLTQEGRSLEELRLYYDGSRLGLVLDKYGLLE